jgi:serine/threonine-protein kinase
MQLFLEAVELDEAGRAALLAEIDDVELRRRVTSLLRADAELGDRDPFTFAVADQAERVLSPFVGSTIDGFRIVRELGRGGMGVVYEAQQQQPERRVALKTLSFAMAQDEHGRARLQQEGDALARLSHPGIAQVYGVGHAAAFDGVPYLVMELVDGEPIDAWCAGRDLPVAERLRLVVELCEAVAHAHTQRVLHRDLKPQNVLVDRDGRVKVLDFGIARVLDGGGHSLQTRSGQVLGTVTYMAPELLASVGGARSDARLDARIDVYSLGVVAYELLSGRPPLDLPDTSLAAVIRQVVEREPEPLGRHCPALAGSDVETVVGKAMAADPALRYADAGALARDLQRVLDDEPVVARRPSTLYRLRKFVRRHRVACSAALLVLASLGGGMVWALLERGEARAARDVAERALLRERLRGQALDRSVAVLEELILESVPHHNGGRPADMEEVVRRFAAQVDDEHGDEPFVQGSVHLLLFEAFHARGELQASAHHLARARACYAASELSGPLQQLRLELAEADQEDAVGDHERAMARFERVLQRPSIDGDAVVRRYASRRLASMLARARRDLGRAERLLRDQLASVQRPGRAWQKLHSTLSTVLAAADRWQEAVDGWRDDVALARRHEPGSLRLATLLQNLGHCLVEHDRRDEGAPLLRESLAIRRRVFGETPHRELAIALDNLSVLERSLGRFDEAIALSTEALAIFRHQYAAPHPELGVCLTELGVALVGAGRIDDAEQRLAEAIEVFDAVAGEPTPQHAAALEHYALLAGSEEQRRRSLALAERALQMRRTIHGPEHELVLRGIDALVRACYVHRDFERAVELARDGHRRRLAAFGEQDLRTWGALTPLYSTLFMMGRHGEAGQWIERAIAGCERCGGAPPGLVRRLHQHLLQVRVAQGDSDRAAALRARIEKM